MTNNKIFVTTRHGIEASCKEDSHVSVEETFLSESSEKPLHNNTPTCVEKLDPLNHLSAEEISDDVIEIKKIIEEYEKNILSFEPFSKERIALKLKCFKEINNILKSTK